MVSTSTFGSYIIKTETVRTENSGLKVISSAIFAVRAPRVFLKMSESNIQIIKDDKRDELSNEEIDRYSRQILLPNISVEGQLLLKKSSVLIVGAGGLGCPCSLYLVGSGIGHIGIIDYDEVERNNLHRQVLHTTDSVGLKKVDSAANFLKALNPLVKITTYPVLLNSVNALDIISNFDIVVDATDNVPTRYLLNDACVLLSKPLVSGSALQMEGQLTVYNYKNGPCYRCLFPVPPPPETVTNCGDGGVLGAIPGTIGVLQALETIKIILNQRTLSGSLLLFDGAESHFRKIKLRQKNLDCEVCGKNPTITQLIDYEMFCKAKSNDKNRNLKLLPVEKRISVKAYNDIKDKPHVLIDVRNRQEFKICKLDNAINIPIDKIDCDDSVKIISEEIHKKKTNDVAVFVVCRRGNDSQKAVIQLSKTFPTYEIKDIVGGLHEWSREINPNFPVY